jgi:hypothetical protein
MTLGALSVCRVVVKDLGFGAGKNHSINFPLRDGIDDDSFASIFRPVCCVRRVLV